MPSIKIEIISVKSQSNPGTKAGTTYQSLDVAFRNQTFQNKVEGRKIMSFGATAETFKALAEASPGEVFEIDIVKNAKGFNDWVSAKKSSTGTAGMTPERGPTKNYTSTGATASPKSTYETPEERAKKQVYIVRQSSISNAVDLLSVGQKSPPNPEDVIKTAKIFESYVFDLDVTDLSTVVEDIMDDIPL